MTPLSKGDYGASTMPLILTFWMCHLCIILKGSPVWWEVVGGRKNNVVWGNEGEPCILARVEEMIDLSNNIPEIFILNKVSY